MNISWNPIFNLVMEIKRKYCCVFGELSIEDSGNINSLKFWADSLGIEEYTDFVNNIVVNQHGKLMLLKCITERVEDDLWNNEQSIYRECRSIIIDIEKDILVLAPFSKIFNMNEAPTTYEEKLIKEIEKAKLFEVTNKLDGSLQSARYYDEKIIMCDSFYFDPSELERLADGYSKLKDNYVRLISENDDYTFSFEYINKNDPHVVNYNSDAEGLYLIGMRDIRNGRQLPYRDVQVYATEYNIPMPIIENKTLDEIMRESEMFHAIDKEGWVINISLDGLNSRLVKIKVNDYLDIPDSLEDIKSINTIIRFIDKFDDFISKVPVPVREECLQKYNKLLGIKRKLLMQVNKYYEEAPKDSLGVFTNWLRRNVPDELIEYLLDKYSGEKIDVFSNIKTIMANYEQ